MRKSKKSKPQISVGFQPTSFKLKVGFLTQDNFDEVAKEHISISEKSKKDWIDAGNEYVSGILSAESVERTLKNTEQSAIGIMGDAMKEEVEGRIFDDFYNAIKNVKHIGRTAEEVNEDIVAEKRKYFNELKNAQK